MTTHEPLELSTNQQPVNVLLHPIAAVQTRSIWNRTEALARLLTHETITDVDEELSLSAGISESATDATATVDFWQPFSSLTGLAGKMIGATEEGDLHTKLSVVRHSLQPVHDVLPKYRIQATQFWVGERSKPAEYA